MLVRILFLVLPGALALGSAGVDADVLVPERIARAVGGPAECANLRMMDAVATADGREAGTTSDRAEPWEIRTNGRGVDDLSYERFSYCGRTVEGTVITLSDGTTARVPGRARVAHTDDGRVHLSVR